MSVKSVDAPSPDELNLVPMEAELTEPPDCTYVSVD